MKLGILTSILDGWTFQEVLEIAADMGFSCIEVACWPQGKAGAPLRRRKPSGCGTGGLRR